MKKLEDAMYEKLRDVRDLEQLLIKVSRRDEKLLEENEKLKQMASYRERLDIDKIIGVMGNAYRYLKDLERFERLPRDVFRCIDDLKESLDSLTALLDRTNRRIEQ